MTVIDIDFRPLAQTNPLSAYISAFWRLANPTGEARSATILPDGCFDLTGAVSATEPFHLALSGLGTKPAQVVIDPHTIIVGISFNLPAAEYLLGQPIASLLDTTRLLLAGEWPLIEPADLTDFDHFCARILARVPTLLLAEVDSRKRNFFALLHDDDADTAGIEALAKQVGWSRRQIDRYFRQWFGMSPKAYRNILRYRASFTQLKRGKLFPEGTFADQAHFIRDVKRYSGVTPKSLARNEDDRFIQFSALPPE